MRLIAISVIVLAGSVMNAAGTLAAPGYRGESPQIAGGFIVGIGLFVFVGELIFGGPKKE